MATELVMQVLLQTWRPSLCFDQAASGFALLWYLKIVVKKKEYRLQFVI